MQPGGIRPQPVLTRETAPVAFALRNIVDRKARGRLRAAATAEAIGRELEWLDAEGWRYQLEAPPRVTISPKDNERAAATVDLKVWNATGTLIFRDRIHAWDGFPVLVPDGTQHEEDDGQGGKVRVSNFRESPLEAARADLAHTVRVVTKNGPWVKDKPGTVSTFYAGTNDGSVRSSNATYATARNGSSFSVSTTATDAALLWNWNGSVFFIREHFMAFDTSAIADTDVVSDATLSLYVVSTNGIEWTSVYARAYDYGAAVTSADWRATDGTSAGDTLLASIARTSISTGAYNALTSEAGFLAAVNLTGITGIYCLISNAEAATAPTGTNDATISTADYTGTTQDPKLVVTHTAAITVTPTTASLTTATFAPTVSVSDNKSVTPSALALTTALFAPTAAITANQIVTPATLAAALAAFAPSVPVGQRATPDVAALVTATFAPLLTSDITVTPDTLAALLSSFAATVLTPNTVTPATLAAMIDGFAPAAVFGHVARPDAAALSLAAFAPTVLNPRVVTPDTLAAALTGFAPIASTSRILTPDKASLLLAAFAPLILTPVVAAPGIGELVTARFAPTTRLDMFAVPGTLATVLTAFAPDAAYTTDVYLTPGPGSLVIAMFAPDLVIPIWLPGPQRGVGRYAAIPVSSLGRVPFVMRGAGRSDRPQRGGGR